MKTISVLLAIAVSTLLIAQTRKSTISGLSDKAELKSFSESAEVREFPLGKLELVKIGGATVGRATLQPGWRWSTSVQPIAKTKKLRSTPFSIPRIGRA